MSLVSKSVKILIVDDNKPTQSLIRSLLVDLGIRDVTIASSGQEGWQKYLNVKPDIMLIDWRMEDMDGLTLTRKIRRDSKSPKREVPIIMMTGYTNKERVIKARDAGVTEFLIKPFTIQNLSRYLVHVLENPREFVMAKNYVGPDRRRKEIDVDVENLKREEDNATLKTRLKTAQKEFHKQKNATE